MYCGLCKSLRTKYCTVALYVYCCSTSLRMWYAKWRRRKSFTHALFVILISNLFKLFQGIPAAWQHRVPREILRAWIPLFNTRIYEQPIHEIWQITFVYVVPSGTILQQLKMKCRRGMPQYGLVLAAVAVLLTAQSSALLTSKGFPDTDSLVSFCLI